MFFRLAPVLCVFRAFCLGLIVFARVSHADPAPADQNALHRVYVERMDPLEHPDYERRPVKPPSWETFDSRTHFTVLRGFGMQDGNAVGYAEEMDRYVKEYRLGDVLWPSYELLFAKNLPDVLDEIKRRNLYLFDIWGYVPGSGPGGYWQQFDPPAGVFDLIETTLGARWLGMDIGEQDGRYVGGYAPRAYPISTDRVQEYLHFQRFFERMTSELGNKNSTLVSLNFGHYFLKEGVYTCIGAETAQGLPNGQVYYVYIRGAGKQYGVPWFGNASVWNRWGWKTYDGEGADHGPTKGTSLSLLKRLIYSHIAYNCLFVGFESGWISANGLTPIGRIQQAAAEWVEQQGQPGIMITPVALMTDFFAGWTFPRHLYTGQVYRVWGNLPYEAGDYLIDGVLDMLYPGYQNSSFYHDESGFLSPTPYGDSADALLSDAPLWLMMRYPLIVVAGELSGGLEIRDKLEAYVKQGGKLLITAGNLSKWPDGLCGVRATASSTRFEAGAAAEPAAFDAHALSLPPNAEVLVQAGEAPLAARVTHGAGQVTVLAARFGAPCAASVSAPIRTEIDRPLAKPFPLLAHVRSVLDDLLREQMLFSVSEGLSLITCRRSPGEYTLVVANHSLAPLPFKIESRCGSIESLTELPLDQSEKGAPGYLPTGLDGTPVGQSNDTTIAGGDVRVFRTCVRESGVQEIPRVSPPARPAGRALPLRNETSIQDAILERPTFFEHFDGVLVDWRYAHLRSGDALRRESAWLQRQGVRVWVDMTSGINLFPDLRLADNDPPEYAASMAVFDEMFLKCSVLGARDIVLSLHRVPENNMTGEQCMQAFESTLRDLCAKAQGRGITLHLRQALHGESLGELAALADRVGSSSLRIAPSIALLLHAKSDPASQAELLKGRVGLLLLSATAQDVNGAPWTAQAPAYEALTADAVAPWLAACANVPVALDAVYDNPDAEYRDIRLVEQATSPR